MMKDEFIKEIMDKVTDYISCDFGVNVDYDDDSNDVSAIRSFIYENYKAEVYNGVTKCVIVFDNEDEVIKVPFNGKFEECCNGYDDYYDDFTPFEFANADVEDASTSWDYCENEYIKYEKAVEDGFADFLLKTRYFGLVHGIPVYIQEKAEEFYNSQYSDKVKLPFSKDAEDSFNNNDDLHYINPIWTIRAIEYYGEERVLDFIQWAKDNGVAGDLHTGNIGFTAEGKPIILDWAGFRD